MSNRDHLIEQLGQWDKWIREGEASKVRQLCRELNSKSIPRDLLIEYAQIARRVGAPDLIVFWYSPLIRSEKTLEQKATEQEKAIYALGLARMGAFREAEQMLKEVSPASDPQVNFYRASLFINQWNYKKAIPELKRYIKNSKVPEYSRLVGRLNLCASLVSRGKSKSAEIEISRLMKKLKKGNITLLLGNLLEIRSQLYAEQGRLDEASEDLDEATELLSKADERSRIYVDKWKAILRLKSNYDRALSLLDLHLIKERAEKVKDWETVRDCDLQEALRTGNQDLILKVYWGSLFTEYKRRALAQFKSTVSVGEHFLWSDSKDARTDSAIDLVARAPTKALKKLFFILTREFYRPLRITELFSFIYDNEFYNPKSGPEKLHRLVGRARNWLADEDLDVDIRSHRNSFKLMIGPTVCLLLKRSLDLSSVNVASADLLNSKGFTAQEWASQNQVSRRTARRRILALVQAGKLMARHRGPRTIYLPIGADSGAKTAS